MTHCRDRNCGLRTHNRSVLVVLIILSALYEPFVEAAKAIKTTLVDLFHVSVDAFQHLSEKE